jgi:WD40 repeat protein
MLVLRNVKLRIDIMRSLVTSVDNKYLISTSDDGTLAIWCIEDLKLVSFPGLINLGKTISSIAHQKQDLPTS